MSCGACNCEECEEGRDRDRAYARRNDDGADPQYINQHWSNAAPANEVQAKAWGEAALEVYDSHPGLKVVSTPAMINLILQKVGARPDNFRSLGAQIHRFLIESPMFEIRKGKNGGVFRKESVEACGPKKTVPQEESRTLTPPPIPTQPINDHVCKHCGNTSVSKTERSCWKCGGLL